MLSTFPGVYLFLDKNNKILYVGKAKNLKERVSNYFSSKKNLGEKTLLLVSKTKKIKTIETYSEVNSLVLEANLIRKYKPEFNIRFTDDKAYLYIKITIKDTYPKVLVSRRIDDNKSLFFGPYPNAKELRLVLKTIRKVFPYQSVKNHPKKICLYNHLGLCPCPEVFKLKDYKKRNIKYIINFLKGENKKILKELTKERNTFSKNEDFEKAALIQEKIKAINLITNPDNKIFDFESNPNLAIDIKLNQLEELTKVLNKNGYKIKKLERIECFDVSNLSGTKIAGSMVVFKNGGEEKSEYRKFKLKSIKKQNDFLAMDEIIKRRLNHNEWKKPDLIVVDGGKPQIRAALNAIKEKNKKIPVIGLAKKEEIIITSDFKQIRLKYDSKALLILRRLRDEAHRFAILYHKKLRSKYFLSS